MVVGGELPQYANENYGTGKICDYIAASKRTPRSRITPARKAASAAVREAEKTLAAGHASVGLPADLAITAAKNAAISSQKSSICAREALVPAVADRKDIPAKLHASDIDPDARVVLVRAC
jgi:hypothetical protein